MIDLASQTVVDTIDVAPRLSAIAITSDSSTLYAALADGGVWVIDLATKAHVADVPDLNGSVIGSFQMSADGTLLYGTDYLDNTVAIIDTGTDTVAGYLTTGSGPTSARLSPDGELLYVCNISDNTVSVFDLSTRSTVATIPVGTYPAGIGIGPVPVRAVTALAPATVWIGLKNSDDVGVRLDLKADVYAGTTLVASGELDSFAGGSSGFNNAHLATIPFGTLSPTPLPTGTTLSITISVRNACSGSGHNSGTARLWYNDSAADSHFGATIGNAPNDYYLRDSFGLSTTAGTGPTKTVDTPLGAKCSAFKAFGTWTTTP